MDGKLKIDESMDSKEVLSKEKWNKVRERLKNILQKKLVRNRKYVAKGRERDVWSYLKK